MAPGVRVQNLRLERIRTTVRSTKDILEDVRRLIDTLPPEALHCHHPERRDREWECKRKESPQTPRSTLSFFLRFVEYTGI